MRPLIWLPLALAVCVAGCNPPAGTSATNAPSAPAAPGTPATPAADPIVGKWQISSEQAVVVFDFAADKKVTVDGEATRAGLLATIEKRIESEAGSAQDREKKKNQAREILDQRLKEFAEFSGTWEKAGDLYKLQRTGRGQGGGDVSWAKVEGDQLIPTNDKGERKEDEPVATRVRA